MNAEGADLWERFNTLSVRMGRCDENLSLRFILDFEILYLGTTAKICVPIMNFAVAEKI